MKKFVFLLFLGILGINVFAQNSQMNWDQNPAEGFGPANNLHAESYGDKVYSLIVLQDETCLICTDTIGNNEWEWVFDSDDPEGIVRMFKVTPHGIVVMGTRGVSLMSFDGSWLHTYNYSYEQGIDEDFFGSGNGTKDYTHREVFWTDTSLVFVGTIRDNDTEDWEIDVKHADLDGGGYYWNYVVNTISFDVYPVFGYNQGTNAFIISQVDNAVLNTYSMNLNSGSVGQASGWIDIPLLLWDENFPTENIYQRTAEVIGSLQHLFLETADTVYHITQDIASSSWALTVRKYGRSWENVQPVLEEFCSVVFGSEGYGFLLAGDEIVRRISDDWTYEPITANILEDGGSTTLEGSPRMAMMDDGSLIVIYNDHDDNNTHLIFYDEYLNVVETQTYNGQGVKSFMYGVAIGNNGFYLYGYNRLFWDPFIIVPALSYWINETSKIAESNIGGLVLYPNPTVDYLKVKGLSESANYQIFDIKGNLLMSGIILENKVCVSELTSGAYVFRIGCENKLFIKQ